MEWFVFLGVLLVIFIILAAVTSYRARKRAEMVGTSREEIQAQKAEAKARNQERAQERGGSWGF